ncbi:MAG: 2-amino-4-hydroxy-6-hydroxymethyldihydropteridine diphosphokinase [Candidatus Brevundimonas phytovorans]|nr:2-amino-4-hydroxy-6-hydroxymethyldihydropteridine diphosphokinase [Brevundimonas sp.]WEK59014.1 MAG: 2-amino-4-hydroxy-6-hydroxymethyldihydropteridine diphosphokinase [Brevundimonas sp.]
MSVPTEIPDGDLDLDEAVIVALGCNDKGVWVSCEEALEAALARFRAEGIDVLARSSWWSSQAWPDPSDPPFLNGVVVVRTAHDPGALMSKLSRMEDVFDRRRSVRNAPRTLDLDLIAYGRLSGDLEGLILPHPRAADRLFVMGPLAEIAPEWRHPTAEAAAKDLAATCTVGVDARPLRRL